MKRVQDWFWGVGGGGGSVMWVCGSEIHHTGGQYNTNLLNVRVSDSIWWFISHCYLNLYDFITLPCIPKPLNHMYGIYFTLSAERCSGIVDVHAAWVYCFKMISKRWNWIGRGVEEINWLGLSDMSSVLTFCWPLNWIMYNHSHPRPPPRICCLDLDTVSIADLENICILPQYIKPWIQYKRILKIWASICLLQKLWYIIWWFKNRNLMPQKVWHWVKKIKLSDPHFPHLKFLPYTLKVKA